MQAWDMETTSEPQALGSVLDGLLPNHAEELRTVGRQESPTKNPDINYLLTKREPIFPPYIRSLCRSFGEGSVLEALRQLDGIPASNAYLGSVCRRIAEGRE